MHSSKSKECKERVLLSRTMRGSSPSSHANADFDQQDAVYGCPKRAVPTLLREAIWVRTLFCEFSSQKMQHAMQVLQQRILSCGETLLLFNDSDSGPFHIFEVLWHHHMA